MINLGQKTLPGLTCPNLDFILTKILKISRNCDFKI